MIFFFKCVRLFTFLFVFVFVSQIFDLTYESSLKEAKICEKIYLRNWLVE